MKMNSEKQAARSTLEERTAPQRRDSVGTKRSMEPPQPTPGASGGCTTAAPRERSGSNVSGILSLKRCGMEEVLLLDHYGFLDEIPVWTRSS